MPYKRNYRNYRKRPYRKRRVNRKPKATVASVNRKVMKIQRAIEYKHLDTFYQNTVDLTGTVFPITNALQGTVDTARVGDKLTTTSVQIKYQLSQYDAPYQTFRVVCLRSRGSAGNVPPTLSDVYIQGTGPQTQVPAVWLYNLDYFRSSQAKVLYDRVFTLQGPNADEAKTISRSIKIPFRSNIQFIAGSASANNHLYMMIISDSGTTPSPRVVANVRINYLDL